MIVDIVFWCYVDLLNFFWKVILSILVIYVIDVDEVECLKYFVLGVGKDEYV